MGLYEVLYVLTRAEHISAFCVRSFRSVTAIVQEDLEFGRNRIFSAIYSRLPYTPVILDSNEKHLRGAKGSYAGSRASVKLAGFVKLLRGHLESEKPYAIDPSNTRRPEDAILITSGPPAGIFFILSATSFGSEKDPPFFVTCLHVQNYDTPEMAVLYFGRGVLLSRCEIASDPELMEYIDQAWTLGHEIVDGYIDAYFDPKARDMLVGRGYPEDYDVTEYARSLHLRHSIIATALSMRSAAWYPFGMVISPAYTAVRYACEFINAITHVISGTNAHRCASMRSPE